MVNRPVLSVDNFWKLLQDNQVKGAHIELLNGTPVKRAIDSRTQAVTTRLTKLLLEYVRPRKLGQVLNHTGFYRARDVQNVRVPHVAFVSYERTQPLTKQGFTPYMPDIAVLIQPDDSDTMQSAERALFFLRNGSSLVWIIHPDTRSVDVCTRSPRKSFRVFKVPEDGTLIGGDVLPGFSLNISEIFAGI
jgi:Uma2 family endonuclease